MNSLTKQELGKLGEELAVSYLRKNGYKILERNYRWRKTEIDIIAQDRYVICFIEVKARTKSSFAYPEESVGQEKQRQLSKAALIYIKKFRLKDNDLRFDVVTVLFDENSKTGRVDLIKDAFSLAPGYFF